MAALALGIDVVQARGDAAAHVDDVGELVHHDVVAGSGRFARLVDVAPGEHHRAAAHRLAAQLLVVGVDDAVVVLDLAPGDDRIFMDDDADEAVEPFEAELERGQAGLRGDRHRHLVA